MPTKETTTRARADARKGKKPTTQAGEFVREEMHKLKAGSGNVRSRKQAIAIGLSEARRSGVSLGARADASPAQRKRASRDDAIGRGDARPSPTRSSGAKKAARTRARLYHRAVA
ncbi:MAG TPA: DUF6496 domain-containing protein [Opitutaceae bacterium]|jgi:hypothetical protein|nr:DUF6496 domain-containing protein [Opitutaceae bacterium]